MKKTSLFFLIAICLLACKKTPIQFTIKGKINDLAFNNGLALANIDLYEVKAGSTQKTHISATSTDSEGNYSIAFDRDQAEKYYIEVNKNQYFSVEKEIYFSDLSTEKDNTVNIDIDAMATVSWTIKNIGQADSTDVYKLQKLNGKTDCTGCCPNSIYTYAGALVNDTLTCITKGNKYVTFYKIDNQAQTSVLDSVYCTAFQTSYYKITY
jgi:hypothetical protein